MAIGPKPPDTDAYMPAKPLILDELFVMETVEFRRFASKKSDEPRDDDDTGSWGIGSMTVADLAEFLEDDSPTDETPIVQDDETFI